MSWFEIDGHRINYEESGQGQPLLLLPGWGGILDELDDLRQELAHHFRVIAADLPGSGRSLPQPRTFTASYYRDDAILFLRMLDELEALPAHLVGFSDGGEYALIMGAERPGAVRSIAVWGAAGTIPDEPEVANAMFRLLDEPAPGLEEFAAYMSATYGENARPMLQSWAEALKVLIATGGDLSRSAAGNISCPVLLIAAAQDMFAPVATVAELATAIPNAELVTFDGRHALHREHPDRLIATVTDWLTRHS